MCACNCLPRSLYFSQRQERKKLDYERNEKFPLIFVHLDDRVTASYQESLVLSRLKRSQNWYNRFSLTLMFFCTILHLLNIGRSLQLKSDPWPKFSSQLWYYQISNISKRNPICCSSLSQTWSPLFISVLVLMHDFAITLFQ